jgi:hypothetical protein
MRKTLWIEILVGVIVIVGVAAVLLTRVFNKSAVQYTIYSLDEYGICFVVDPSYKFNQFKDRIFYSSGHNSGTLQLFKRQVNPKYKSMPTGEIPMSLHKVKNLRILEYQITKELVLRDEFDYAKRTPGNIIPRKNACQKLMQQFPVVKLKLAPKN